MEGRSIVEPVRSIVLGKAQYYEALVTALDPLAKELVACYPTDSGISEACFRVSYDTLVLAVGSINNTFGIKGVNEYCNNFKSIEDAGRMRRRLSECFERAALPNCSTKERQQLLSFIVVGGGPTGVEVAAEVYDMIHDDLSRLYPELIRHTAIRLVELTDHVLSTYDRKISEYTASTFNRAGIELVLNTRVSAVGDGYVTVVDKQRNETKLEFGLCVWATGIAKHPLVQSLQDFLVEQTHFRSIVTNEYLQVKGSKGSIYALGDAATIEQPKALERADELFEHADINNDGKLSLTEMRDMMLRASRQYSHFEEHARFLDSKVGAKRWGGMLKESKGNVREVTETTEFTKDEFKNLIGKIDQGLRALPATAQVARQQGEYLAKLFLDGKVTGEEATSILSKYQKPFRYNHKGSLAYVGQDRAVMDVPKIGPLFGYSAGVAWKGFETISQFSWRNRLLVAIDWCRTKVFGRDVSRF